MSRKVITSFWAKPIPDRRFDWEAWRDGDEPNDNGSMALGYGRTEQEAIADLLENFPEDDDEQLRFETETGGDR